MSTRANVPRFAALLLVPGMIGLLAGPAFAQAVEGEQALSVPEAPAGRPGELAADGFYTVIRGDTLWDLSQTFLQNPWYWPKIWADNPFVENPHWIYPGDRLRIRLHGEALPGAMAELDEEELEDEDEPLPRPRQDVAEFSTGSLSGEALGEGSDLVSVAGGRRLSFIPPASTPVRLTGLVTERELAESGTVAGSFEQKTLLTTYDQVYLQFANLGSVKIGESFTVFRPTREVIHPVTGKRFGHHTELVGTVTVLAKEGGMAVAEINTVTEAIERGDRIGPAAALYRDVKPAPATVEAEGVVLSTFVPDQAQIAEWHVVYVDLGAKDGLREGNLLAVSQQGDGMTKAGTRERIQFPTEIVATLMVFDVREDSAAAMVLKSVREVSVGDSVSLRAARRLAGAGGDVR